MANETSEKTGWVEGDPDEASAAYEKWLEGKDRRGARKPPDGDSMWQILPRRAGETRFGKWVGPFLTGVYVHFAKDPADPDQVVAVGICPRKTMNQPCDFMCGYVSLLRKSGSEADDKLAGDMAATEHVLCAAVELGAKDPQPEALEVPQKAFRALMTIYGDKGNGTDFTHPKTGRPVIFNKVGKGFNTVYTVRPAVKAAPIRDPKWLERIPDLSKCFDLLDQEAVKARLTGPQEQEPWAAGDRQVEGPRPDPEPEARGETVDLVKDPVTGVEMTREEYDALAARRAAKRGGK
jgi:hypothetical protein